MGGPPDAAKIPQMALRAKIRLEAEPAGSVPPPPDSGVRESVSRLGVRALAPRPLSLPPRLPSLPPSLPVSFAPSPPVSSAPPPLLSSASPVSSRSVASVALPSASAPITDRLSYAIYSAAELQSHIVEAQRLIPQPVPVPGWPDLEVAGRDAGQGLLSWWRFPKPRPRVMDVCRPQLTTLAHVTKAILATVPWKRLAIVAGMVVGSTAALLFAVITVGELTDDVKPGKHIESTMSVQVPVAAPTAAAVPATMSFEIVETLPPAKADAKAKKKHVKRSAPVGPDRFVP